MIIDAHLVPASLPHARFLAESVAVVVDILRATTTITAALESGAERVVTVREVEQARAARESGSRVVLGGERGSVRIDGFDLANSPLEYTPDRVGGATVVLTTTNGTAAVEDARSAQHILCGSIRNAGAVAGWIAGCGSSHLTLVCAGTHGQTAMEDVIGAGAIIDGVASLVADPLLTDAARLARLAWLDARSNLLSALRAAQHGRTLVGLGADADIAFCAEHNASNVVPLLSEQGFVIAPPPSPAVERGMVNQQLER